MIYNKQGINHHCLQDWLAADVHHCFWFTLAQWLHFLSIADEMMADGTSLNVFTARVNIRKASLSRWCNNIPADMSQDLLGILLCLVTVLVVTLLLTCWKTMMAQQASFLTLLMTWFGLWWSGGTGVCLWLALLSFRRQPNCSGPSKNGPTMHAP